MIQVISQFRVKNDREIAVRAAFGDRPHLVDAIPGFLGMEVFTAHEDGALFYLVTRWTDAGCYHAWHASDAYRRSHQGIPRGLKLDGEHTQVTFLDRLVEAHASPAWATITADSAPFLAQCLASSRTISFLLADVEGTILRCNDGLTELLQRSPADVVGQALWAFLPDTDAVALRQRLQTSRRDFDASFLLNFVNVHHSPVTLSCRLDRQPNYFLLFGEVPHDPLLQLPEELLQLNNQLAVLTRENAQKNKELEKTKAELTRALEDLQTSHWHLRKIQEVLPLCMGCGKVKAGAEWQEVVDYLKKNALFLSHGYCPACTAQLIKQWSLPTESE